jgi:hypothetical protein
MLCDMLQTADADSKYATPPQSPRLACQVLPDTQDCIQHVTKEFMFMMTASTVHFPSHAVLHAAAHAHQAP